MNKLTLLNGLPNCTDMQKISVMGVIVDAETPKKCQVSRNGCN